jgi:predicted house-cleaning noncanonical NTP pyrophosphatase (MazG superfamily)
MMKKLVRDLVPEIIEKQGKIPICYRASDEEYKLFLKEKLKEEACEFLQAESRAESMEELADVLEVLDAIYVAYQFDKASLDDLKKDKNMKRGGFKQKIILDKIEEKS